VSESVTSNGALIALAEHLGIIGEYVSIEMCWRCDRTSFLGDLYAIAISPIAPSDNVETKKRVKTVTANPSCVHATYALAASKGNGRSK